MVEQRALGWRARLARREHPGYREIWRGRAGVISIWSQQSVWFDIWLYDWHVTGARNFAEIFSHASKLDR